MGKLMGLDIGCGERKVSVDGYSMMSVDIRGEVRPDIVAPLDKIPVPDGSYDLVFASHVLEHVKRADTYKTLKEWRRVLKPGGKLQLVVPDLETAAIELLSCKTTQDTFDILWGAQNHDFNVHYSGYTWQLLDATIKKFGFEVNKLETRDRQIFMTATKLDGEYF
jgi:predicted SAM-dependent methyltransferase